MAFCVSCVGPPLLRCPATATHDGVGGDAVRVLTCDYREYTYSCSSVFYLASYYYSSLISIRSARITSIVSFYFLIILVCYVIVSFRFRISDTSLSNPVPLPSLSLANSNLAVSLFPTLAVLSFLRFLCSLVRPLTSTRDSILKYGGPNTVALFTS